MTLRKRPVVKMRVFHKNYNNYNNSKLINTDTGSSENVSFVKNLFRFVPLDLVRLSLYEQRLRLNLAIFILLHILIISIRTACNHVSSNKMIWFCTKSIYPSDDVTKKTTFYQKLVIRVIFHVPDQKKKKERCMILKHIDVNACNHWEASTNNLYKILYYV